MTNAVALARGSSCSSRGWGSPGRLLRLLWPLAVAALMSGGAPRCSRPRAARVLVEVGWLTITTGPWPRAALRELAIALPGITVLLTTDPTDLADGSPRPSGCRRGWCSRRSRPCGCRWRSWSPSGACSRPPAGRAGAGGRSGPVGAARVGGQALACS
ncbi:hypothetical protein QJS66_17970 [Kocuria rhizophila]|nr:hypothetical protein QJS66_17970 [Kocuria rhizophila]